MTSMQDLVRRKLLVVLKSHEPDPPIRWAFTCDISLGQEGYTSTYHKRKACIGKRAAV